MKLNFTTTMTAACYAMPSDNLTPHYTAMADKIGLSNAIKEALADFEEGRITESYRDRVIREVCDFATKKVMDVEKVLQTAKKLETPKKVSKRKK
jgi:hypothetical protein